MKNSKTKRTMALLLVLLMSALVFSGCSDNGDGGDLNGDGNLPVIGIIQLAEHPSLNTIYEETVASLEELGYIHGETVTIDYQNGLNDQSTMKSIVQKFAADDVALIIAIATPAAQAALGETTDIPIIFSACTDPVGSKLVADLEVPGGNVTGTSDAVSAAQIMDLAQQITPGFETVGALYSSGESNSEFVVNELKEYAEANGLTVIDSPVMNTSEIQQAASSLVDRVDIVFSPIDNTVAGAMPAVTEILYAADLPFYVSADSMVSDGGLATYGINYTALGRETGKMAARVLAGENPGEIPVMRLTDVDIYVNPQTAELLGIELSEEILSNAVLLP